MNTVKKFNNVLFKEGIVNFVKRKLNISYLDSVTTYTIKYREKETKIILNRQFGFVDMMIFKNGIYEKDIIDDMYNELDKGKIMLDIGSNIGQHSLILSSYCKEIYAFEPIPKVYQQFNRSIAKNNIKNIKTFNLGISNRKETKEFNFIEDHAGASSFIDRANEHTNKITVKTDTLENIIGEIHFDLMKIDVEGYEAVVILGNKEIILKNRPVIFLEYDRQWISEEGSYTPDDLFNFFNDNKFEIYSRVHNKVIQKSDFSNVFQDNWIIKPINIELN
ncbi:FkbM family methyltransferase [Chryseobacterium sp. C3]|uniref:FkbM family methyltransferase n=1 Tax=Chryseobacterium sp. C3 TaxID=2761532 RepID=UPI001626D252|nr:FkbM family methyltransferase [Chryseobacterium sp. C3]